MPVSVTGLDTDALPLTFELDPIALCMTCLPIVSNNSLKFNGIIHNMHLGMGRKRDYFKLHLLLDVKMFSNLLHMSR